MPLGVGFELEAGLVNCRVLAHAGQHILQLAAVRRVIEHVVGSDERRAAAFRERSQRRNARAIIAAVGMRSGEIERRAGERGFDRLTSPSKGEEAAP